MATSLRNHLLRLVLPPMAALLGIGAFSAYIVSLRAASVAYDQALVDVALALGERIQRGAGTHHLDLPKATERALRTDKFDTIYYSVRAPDGSIIGGETDLPVAGAERGTGDGQIYFDGSYRGAAVRVVALEVPCDPRACVVLVAETTLKRDRLARDILLSSVLPELFVALAALVVIWFGVRRGLAPLEVLSGDLRARSASDLRPIDVAQAPQEAQPLLASLNQLFLKVDEASRNQQRFVANAAHQLRTPLAGLQAHAELALAQPVPESARSELEQVRSATVRTARLANQLLALARAEPGGYRSEAFRRLNLRLAVEETADEWLRWALEREIDLGFELADAEVRGDAFLLREAVMNLVHNALEYTPVGGRVTIRTGLRGGKAFMEVDDSGSGIPPTERGRVRERFYRIPGTTGAGSGLGLAIVSEIAQAHHAELTIGDGSERRGSRVTLTFVPA